MIGHRNLLNIILTVVVFLIITIRSGFASVFAAGDNSVDQAAFAQNIPVYWINLDRMEERRISMQSHLDEYGFRNTYRIPALTPKTCNILMIESSCFRVGYAEIAILCSHIKALHYAITHDDSTVAQAIRSTTVGSIGDGSDSGVDGTSPYILVLEDDVRFKFNIDFESLIENAPKGFGAIQLMLSHKTHIDRQWSNYADDAEVFTYRPRNSSMWSAQAVLYNKERIRPFIENIVARDRTGKIGYKLVNIFDYKFEGVHLNNKYRPAVASDCLFSDTYLYSMADPTYILNVPLMNGALIGINSTYHHAHVAFHIDGYAQIQRIQKDLTIGVQILPKFASFRSPSDKSTDRDVDWEEIALKYPTSEQTVPKRNSFNGYGNKDQPGLR